MDSMDDKRGHNTPGRGPQVPAGTPTTPRQVKDCLDSTLRLYKTYKRFVKRSGTARPDEDEEKTIRGVLAANGIMDRVLHHMPEIQKIIHNDPAHDITSDEEDNEEESGKGKGKGRKRAHSPEEQLEHLHRMETVMSESMELLAAQTQISQRELDIATRREEREALTQRTHAELKARQLRLREMSMVGEWLDSGNPYLVAQAAMIIATHNSADGPFQSAPFVHPSLSSSHAHSSIAGPSRAGGAGGSTLITSTAPITSTVPITSNTSNTTSISQGSAHTPTGTHGEADMDMSDESGGVLERSGEQVVPPPTDSLLPTSSTNANSASAMDI
ncbi:hypothetical protein FRC09_004371 [Ceratobasidium sp. 395]|nr:hypothetical protein FRC09_004371 [Ceratobasidium sp. 395]